MSPTTLRKGSYRFFFFSREEPRKHVHIVSNDGEAKFWLEPEIELSKSYQFTRQQLKEIEKIIEDYYNDFTNAWDKYFKS